MSSSASLVQPDLDAQQQTGPAGVVENLATPDPGKDIAYAELIARYGTDSIVVTDTAGQIEWANAAFSRLSGYPIDEVIGRKPKDILQGHNTNVATVDEIRQAVAQKLPIETEILNYNKNGQEYWTELKLTPIFDDTGVHTHFMSVERDITARKQMEEETQKALVRERQHRQERKTLSIMGEWLYAAQTMDELFDVVSRSMSVVLPGVCGYLYLYDEKHQYLERNASWGYPRETLDMLTSDQCWALRRGRSYWHGQNDISFPCDHYVDPDESGFCIPISGRGETIGLISISFPGVGIEESKSGSQREFMEAAWELAVICAEQISLALANVTLREQLQETSVRDQLTGLWNRRWFQTRCQSLLHTHGVKGETFSLVMADIDHFKTFNDTHGHDAGDAVLVRVAEVLSEFCTDDLFPCRLGGEEFVVLTTRGPEEALASTEEIRARIENTDVDHQGRTLPPVTMSFGISHCPNHGQNADALLKAADIALYASKEAGRNRVTDYDPDTHKNE